MFREHLITGQPILFAPERAERPNAFAESSDPASCPFCPGHEHETPAEIVRVGDPWSVRVFPNKYPAAEHHELIVESPIHGATFDVVDDAAAVVRVYVERATAMSALEGVHHVALFKNEGPIAGASIPHLHSQLIGLPFVPPRITQESEAFARASTCPLCRAIERHRRDGLLIAENDSFVAIAPHASSFAYQQWLIPRRHHHRFIDMTADEMRDLGALLQRSAAALRRVRGDVSFNWSFTTFADASAHWYVDVFPRLTTVAGLELGSGTFIEIIDPAAAARLLR